MRNISKEGKGVILIGIVVVIWVSSSNLLNWIFSTTYDKPLLVTYFSTSLFSIYLLGFFTHAKSWRPSQYTVLSEPSSSGPTGQSAENHSDSASASRVAERSSMDSVSSVVIRSAIFCPLWFFANYFFNLSLGLTSVSSNTIISTSSSVWTFIMGTFFAVEKGGELFKLVAVLLSCFGVALVAFADRNSHEEQSDSLAGDFAAACGAFLYACYAIFLKKKVDETRVSVAMFFGFLGACNFVLIWPLLLLFHFLGIETLELPSVQIFFFLVLNGAIGTVLSDYIWSLGLLFSSPLIATLGLSLTSPLAMCVDAVLKGKPFSFQYLVGAALAFLGFLLVNLSTSTPFKKISSFVTKRFPFPKRKGDLPEERESVLVPVTETE